MNWRRFWQDIAAAMFVVSFIVFFVGLFYLPSVLALVIIIVSSISGFLTFAVADATGLLR